MSLLHKSLCNSAVINNTKYGIKTHIALPLNKHRSVYLKVKNERKCIEMTSVGVWKHLVVWLNVRKRQVTK